MIYYHSGKHPEDHLASGVSTKIHLIDQQLGVSLQLGPLRLDEYSKYLHPYVAIQE